MNEYTDLFQERLLKIQDNLYNFAYMLTSDKEEAKDLLQDTTLKALDNREKYIDNINFKGWVFTIMRNIFINNYRRVVRNQTMVDQTEDLYHLNLPQESGFDTPDGSYTVKEIGKAIASFPDEYRIPFSMHVTGYKYHKIAQYMKLPLGTVKSRIFFARQKLQNILKDYR
ncbi:MAG: RNA polymerase sigma factor [Paludibacteraceae bacterium]|nr:RNA polymerase sigma factor [Paludibacteraceae bacterium]